jgi:hypothetical protein
MGSETEGGGEGGGGKNLHPILICKSREQASKGSALWKNMSGIFTPLVGVKNDLPMCQGVFLFNVFKWGKNSFQHWTVFTFF